MSGLRKSYILKFIFRIFVFIISVLIYFKNPESFSVLDGFNFFKKINVFHILWSVWIFDMIMQVIPVKDKIPLGSQKLFANRFRPIIEKINKNSVREYISFTTKGAYKVFVLWFFLIGSIGAFYFAEIIDKKQLFLICVFFYVCDLFCVLIWCPFRLIMKNKCCTTCRIFNWDHLMMFSPLVFAGGFYALSLFCFSVVDFCVWELCVLLYPERFWEMTNISLKCSECTDKLCTQYCKKLR